MALSSFSKLFFLAIFMLCSFITLASACDFSIVGYSPDDLTCINKLINLFESWIDKHGKKYKSLEEKLHRFEIFKDNLKHIDEKNKVNSNYWLGLNEFADLSHEEFKKIYLGLKADRLPQRDESLQEFKYRDFESLPKSVDWRKKGVVSRIKNQGSCGLMDYAFTYIVSKGGLHKEEDYPYLMEEGTCEENKDEAERVTISGYHDVPANDEQSLLKAHANQPLSVAIEASGRDFQFYSGGVFDGHCGSELDHGVAAVGYGSSKGLEYIIVKNSWGPKWGEKGFIRMKRNTGKPSGMCGINKMASFPTKTK
ncbi:hypothetical protein BUALT_Bualt15G0137200 [Buddleja alternifolia]|uniref:Uncharacterized protein n=1 Tax=Buddleja alternifolia TaxID=168488 RepID=A0AAV6WP11_9LAMI|nr:hypothetical protein BUALT_Bualt15G0137200 [Buddleja alternifolia]